MLDFNEIAMFVNVVDAGSFAEAARRLGVPANTLSRRVQWLEQRFGVRLMHRSTRQLCLTEAGREFYEQCSSSIRDISLAGKQMLEGKGVPSGSVRIAAPVGFFKPEWVADFLAEYNQVKLEFKLSDAAVDLIAERIDVAFREGHLPDSSLVARRIDKAFGILVASPSYVRSRGMPPTVYTLADHDCIVLPHPARYRRWLLMGPEGPVGIEVNGRLSVDNHEAMTTSALAGMGIALIPAILAVDHVREGRLVHVLPDYRRENEGLYAILPSRNHPPLAVALFIDFVAQRLAHFWKERAPAIEAPAVELA